MNDFASLLPEHKCGLYLQHNPHKDVYETVAEYLDSQWECRPPFKDDAAKHRSIKSNELWTLQWYPDTPVGFHLLAASTLDELIEFSKEMEEKT